MRLWLVITLFSLFGFAQGQPIAPVPMTVAHDAQWAAIGEKLFFDPILSRDHSIACVSCHSFDLGGADGLAHSIGVDGREGRMNAPTVFNAVFNFKQFWNGRANTLAEQALGPIQDHLEMDLPLHEAASRISQHPDYAKAFAQLTHRNSVTPTDIAKAIEQYEMTLITPDAKFDRYLRGQIKLSPQEEQGYVLFKTLGCIGCHNGVNVGGNSFQKMGAVIPLTQPQGVADRYALTGKEHDKNVFKVPSLRNITLTAPYFHDGSAVTLKEAIDTIAYHNLGFRLTSKEIELLERFLETLTGTLPSQRVAPTPK